MHEMSIIEGVLGVVYEQLHRHPGARVLSVTIQVGQLRQIEPEMLEFCYSAAVIGTALDGSRLLIKSVPAMARCEHCRADFPVQETWFECPTCHEAGARLLTGNELDLIGIELESAGSDKLSAASATVDSVS